MKRDMDLIKTILLYLEENARPDQWIRGLNVEGYTEDQVYYHIKLLTETGLIEGRDAGIDQYFMWYASTLTWEGHEFLDSIRNEAVWNKIQEIVKEKGGSISMEVLKSLAIKVSESLFLS